MTDELFDMIERARDFLRLAQRVAGPALDLFIRLWLAQVFWVSGLVKLHDWEQALYLAREEYPVSWLDPIVAAWTGAGIELVCAPLLAVGLATRFAALPMLGLALVAQYAYRPLDQHLFWAVLLAWYVAMGAGAFSLDRRLARGLRSSALPFARAISHALAAVTRYAGPLAQVLVRVWIAGVFFRSGLTKIDDFETTILLFQSEYAVPLLPPELAAIMATAFELSCPVLLVAGLATRLAALPLIGMTLVIDFTYQHHVDHLYWLMLLGLIVMFGPGLLSLDRIINKLLSRRFPRLGGIVAAVPASDDQPTAARPPVLQRAS